MILPAQLRPRRPAGPLTRGLGRGAPRPERRSLAMAYLLWALGAVALCGVHRFYCRKPASGGLWLFTAGLCGVGQLVDLFLLPAMVEEANRPLLLEQALAMADRTAPPSLERQLLQLARDSGEQGFTINDALLRVDPRGGDGSREVAAEIQRLLHEHLLDVGNDARGRVVYREP